MNKPMRFEDLKVGQHFIFAPNDGDSGGLYVFEKTDFRERTSPTELVENARKVSSGVMSCMPLNMPIVHVISKIFVDRMLD